ncbi:MAG: hypothetical protein U0Z44_11055 [Kouleothrix sp.]
MGQCTRLGIAIEQQQALDHHAATFTWASIQLEPLGAVDIARGAAPLERQAIQPLAHHAAR